MKRYAILAIAIAVLVPLLAFGGSAIHGISDFLNITATDITFSGTSTGGSYSGDGSSLTGINATSDVYGCINFPIPDVVSANSVAVYNGIILAGAVVNTATIDQQYLEVKESDKFLIDFLFTELTKNPAQLEVVGMYNGTSSHHVEVKSQHCSTGVWTDLLPVGADDIPDSSVDAIYLFTFPDLINYKCNGETTVRIDHESNAVATHNIYLDRIQLWTASLELGNAGTVSKVIGFSNGTSNNVTLSGTNGTIDISEDGLYQAHFNLSFCGTPDNDYHFSVYKDGVEQTDLMGGIKLDDKGNLSNISFTCFPPLSAGEQLDVRVHSGISSSFLSIVHGNFNVTKIGD